MIKKPSLGLLADSRPVSLPLASELRQLAFFRTTLVLAVFCTLSVPLEKKTKFIRICTDFRMKQSIFLPPKCTSFLLRSKPLQWSCLHFFNIVKNSARTKGELSISSFPSYLKLENASLHFTQNWSISLMISLHNLCISSGNWRLVHV